MINSIQKKKLFSITKNAGLLSLDYFKKPIKISRKANNTPVTEADIIVSDYLENSLKSVIDIPILSEENTKKVNFGYTSWPKYWLIDPIDGTKQFLKGEDDFCICIALIDNNKPVLGLVYSPTKDKLFYAKKGFGAILTSLTSSNKENKISCREQNTINVVLSSNKISNINRPLFDLLPSYKIIKRHSALKLTEISSGNAQLSPKMSATCEWDTAAAQIILEEAGGGIIDSSGNMLRYGTKKDLTNPFFLAYGKIETTILKSLTLKLKEIEEFYDK